jgi:UDP-GlcNAc:undecaprenyl-phosphate GlcNAc-1-phosphate transferase
MTTIYSFTVALFLTIALIPLCVRLGPLLGLMDAPGEARKIHVRSIPRSGGLAMAVGVTLPLLFFLPPAPYLLHLLAATGLIVVFGLLDDHNSLDYKWKFFGQIIAVVIVLSGGLVMQRLPLMGLNEVSPWLAYPLTFLFILGVTNAINLTDGLDGLAAGSTLLTLAVIVALAAQTENHYGSLIALTTIGGVLGFLRYNTHPAVVFMGDTGSQFLGFVAACLSVHVTQADSSAISPVVPLLLLGLPVLDTLTVMIIRLAARRSPFSPDRNHLHHQMIALGFRHNEAVALIYVLQTLLLTLAFALRYAADELLLVVYALFSAALLGILYYARRRQWQFRAERPQQPFIDRRNIFLRKIPWFYPRSDHIVQLLLSLLLLSPLFVSAGREVSRVATIMAPVLLLALLAYRRFPAWSTRLCIYSASVICVYLITVNSGIAAWLPWLDGGFILLAAVLALAMRMTRREQFRLDTQDLLILVLILVAPLLPFAPLNHHTVGEIALRLAVLMYSCEFIIGKSEGKALLPVNSIAILSILAIAVLHGPYSFF